MINARRAAIAVAVLFIVATAASVVGMVMISPILAESDYLKAVSENSGRMTLAVVFMFLAAFSIAGIPITLFPIFRLYDEAVALWFLAVRFFEAIIYIVGGIIMLSLVSLAHEYVGSNASDAPHFQTLGAIIRSAADTAFNVGTAIIFSLSALILSIIFYQTNLVPRWLSVWKFIGAVLLLAQGLLVLFKSATPMLEATLFLPIAVNEMVLAVWLIVMGFDREAMKSLNEKAKVGLKV